MRPEITLFFSDKYLEYDIYSLIKAFWPQAEIQITYDRPEEPSEKTLCLVEYDGEKEKIGGVRFRMEIPDGGAAEALGIREDTPRQADRAIAPDTPKLEIKNQVKQVVYRLLCELTGRALPWGDLTGIRPVGLVSNLLEQGLSDEEILRHMKTEWYVSDGKCRLALETAKTEQKILRELQPESGWSLYIGIPFCPSICLYCSFGSHPLDRYQDKVDDYLAALKTELAAIAGMMKGRRLDTIYIGGGTPTSISAEQLEGLLETVGDLFPVPLLKEYTVEAGRPDTITEEKLEVLRRHGVSRISVNPQTMNDRTLERIGRKHTAKETREAFALARKAGFDNINMDLIVGLPGEGEREVAKTLEEIRALSPDSLTIHSLALKRATRLHLFREEYEDESFVSSEAIMDMTRDCAEEMGMHPYYLYRQKNMAGNFENTGYAAAGKEGLYNILIMEQRQPILAAGSGASTKLFGAGGQIIRIENVKDLTQYLERTGEMIEKKRRGFESRLVGV